MSAAPSPSASAITARLRAAGCVFAEDEAALLLAEASNPAELEEMVERRVSGLPLEQILGWAEFCGLRIAVEPGVFVPRRRSELLVDEAAALVQNASGPSRPIVVVDLCCGSGALGAAAATTLSRAGHVVELHAADVDPAAVACARRNLPAGAQAYEGDLFAPLPAALRGRVDLLLVNAPYVPTAEIELMPPEARDHEAHVALDGGADGLEVQRRVMAEARGWLAPGGHLLVETSGGQAARTAAAVARAGLQQWVVHREETGSTVVIGTRPGSPGAAG